MTDKKTDFDIFVHAFEYLFKRFTIDSNELKEVSVSICFKSQYKPIYQSLINFNSLKITPNQVKEYDLCELSKCWMNSNNITSNLITQELCDLLSNPAIQGLFDAYAKVANFKCEIKLPDIPFEVDDNDIAVKIVRLIKGSEPLGATIKVDHSTGTVIIARIIADGSAFRSGCIEVGDQLLEVNGVSVLYKQPMEIIQLLNVPENESICFKLIPAKQITENKPNASFRYIRCMMDYSINNDSLHPCPEAALNFQRSDILECILYDDQNFIQAKNIGHGSICNNTTTDKILQSQSPRSDKIQSNLTPLNGIGLVPCSSFLKKFVLESNLDLAIEPYEVVEKLNPSNDLIRPIILIGPPGVGRNELKRRLITYHPKKYASTVPHTSRTRRDGVDYYFASRNEMEKWIREGRFIEFGEYNNNLYGTLDEAVVTVIERKKVPVLNAHPLALKLLRTAKFKPIIIFIEPPDLDILKETRVKAQAKSALSEKVFTDADLEKMVQQAEQLDKCHGHLFDARITNGILEESFKELLMTIKKFESSPSWVPKEWVSSNEQQQ